MEELKLGKNDYTSMEAIRKVAMRNPGNPMAALRELGVPIDDDAMKNIQTMFSGLTKNKVPRRSVRIGRNDPCPCGSGRKYKKCCLLNPRIASSEEKESVEEDEEDNVRSHTPAITERGPAVPEERLRND